MAILTSEQITLIRLDIGDGCDVLTDAQIQSAYDTASGDQCGTNAILSQWLWARVRPTTINLINGGQGISRTIVDIYRERMDFWRECAGTIGAPITVGILDLGIDATTDDLTDGSLNWLNW